jgi:hypothetical protein
MKAALTLASLLTATAFAQTPATEQAEPPRTSVREALRARAAEDAKKAPAAKAAPSASTNRPATPSQAPAATPTADAAAAAASDPAKPEGDKAATTVLPKMEVRKGKFSERDYQLAQDLNRQDQEIEREKRNLKVSEADAALNNSKLSSALSVFGGESAQFRKRVAAERVELLEAEKDIIEQIAIAQKPEEKKLLQKQLDELREMRRQLDKSLR